MTTNNTHMRVLATAAMHPIIAQMALTDPKRALDLIEYRMIDLIADRVNEGDEKNATLDAAIDAVNRLHGPVLMREFRLASEEMILAARAMLTDD